MSNINERKEMIASEKRMLAEKIRVVEDRIKSLELRKKSIPYEFPNDNCCNLVKDSFVREGRTSDEDVAKIKKCVVGSFELLDIQVVNYSHTMLPPQSGLSGIWKETTIDMIINNFLKTSIIKVTNDKEDDPDHILSLRCIIKGRLHRRELAELANTMCAARDVIGLTRGLRQYGRLAMARKTALVQLVEAYGDYFQAETTESGMIVEWQDNRFRVCWSIQWNENIEAITDKIDIDVDPTEVVFVNMCQSIIQNLTDKMTDPSVRGTYLMELAAAAAS